MIAIVLAAAQTLALAVVETDPPSPAVLHNNETAYVHVHYQSDRPLRIFVTPYSHGKVAKGPRMSGSPLYDAGEGDALSWFDLPNAADVDQLMVQAGDGRVVMAPVSLTWDGQPGEAHVPAEWVAPMQTAVRERQRAESARAGTAGGIGSGGIGAVGGMAFIAVFGVIVLGSLVAAFVWPLWGVVRWSGRWRIAAVAPLAFAALWAAKDVIDLSRDPTSHNLLPFEFIEAAVIVVPYMIVVSFLKRFKPAK